MSSGEISAEGGSTVRIDGRPATVALLRDIGQNLINIHGQHDNQILLSAERHLSIIDAFGELEPMAREYREEFEKLRTLLRQMKSLSVGEDEIKRRSELLRLEIEEIEKARLSPRLEEMLTEKARQLRESEKIAGALGEACRALEGIEDLPRCLRSADRRGGRAGRTACHPGVCRAGGSAGKSAD